MSLEHGGVIHFIDMVARKYQHIFGIIHLHEMHVLIDGVRRALVPAGARFGLIRRKDMDAAVGSVEIPRLAVADVFVENQRLILRQHPHGVDPRIYTVGEREIDDAILCAECDGGLCNIVGESKQPAALSAGQKHGDAFLFSLHNKTP